MAGTSGTSKKNTNTAGRSGSAKKKQSAVKSGTKKTSAPKPSSQKKPAVKQETYSESVLTDVKITVIGLLSAICLLSVFGLAGNAGNKISYVLFGLMGVTAFAFPFLLFLGSAFHMANRHSRLARHKMEAAVVFMFLLMAMIAIFSRSFTMITTIKDSFSVCGSSHTGGGIIGYAIGSTLVSAFGKFGSAVILLILMVLFFILVTGRAIYVTIGTNIAERVSAFSEHIEEVREEKAEARLAAISEEYRDYDDTPPEDDYADIDEEKPVRRKAAKKKKEKDDYPDLDEEPVVTKPEESDEEQETPSDIKKRFFANIRIGKSKVFNGMDDEDDEIKETVPKDEKPEEEAAVQPEETEEPAGIQLHPIEKAKKPEWMVRKDNNMAAVSVQPEEEVSEEEELPQEDSGEPSAFLFDGLEDDYVPESQLLTGAALIKETLDNADTPLKQKRKPTPSVGGAEDVTAQIRQEKVISYKKPPLKLLDRGTGRDSGKGNNEQIKKLLQETFDSFGVDVDVQTYTTGPSVTRFELAPAQGVKVSRILALQDDIKLKLAASSIRIEAPIPGKSMVGIEIPNEKKSMVKLRDLLESEEASAQKSKIAFAVGKDISGKTIIANIEKMPHLLIAGATGSGKSVCINTIIMSILYRADPNEVKLIMVDPKVVELNVYNGIPHLLLPVVTDPKKAAGALNWAVTEMMNRYQKFAELNTKNIETYNAKVESGIYDDGIGEPHTKMPQIVIIIDELSDLMLVAKAEVENSIMRLAQLARAAGIHLVIATQRPSVNVITGIIKANIPSRIAFAVSSQVDSRTIIDMGGAEKLLGNGDMLFHPQNIPQPKRVQGAFVSEEEIARVVGYIMKNNEELLHETKDISGEIQSVGGSSSAVGPVDTSENGRDSYFEEAGRYVIKNEKASIGNLQRVYRIGFNRAARIMDQLAEAGVVGPDIGTKPRKILMTMEEFEAFLENGNA